MMTTDGVVDLYRIDMDIFQKLIQIGLINELN